MHLKYRLAVGKDSTVVSRNDLFHETKSHLLVNMRLRVLNSKNRIVTEVLYIIRIV